MPKTSLWNILLILLQLNHKIIALTHWVVTENGRIEPELDSPFYLRRPYDLLSLLDQEKRRTEINRLYDDLIERKEQIDRKSTGIKSRNNIEQVNDEKCQDILKLQHDTYFMIATNGSDRNGVEINLVEQSALNNVDTIPYCIPFTKLHYSVLVYEHLESIINRKNFSNNPHVLLESFLPVASIEQFGQQIVHGLTKNSSSWIHYNLGLMYWRLKGDGYQAIECARRALYFVPKEYRDIPLLNLGGFLHHTKHSTDAIVLVRGAVDHRPTEANNYLALGNIYASIGDYKNSLVCYRKFLQFQDIEDMAVPVKKYIFCFMRLHTGFTELHDSLQDILSDLHDYHSQQQQWLRLQERLLWEIVPYESHLTLDNAKQLLNMRPAHHCVQQLSDESVPTITCDFTSNSDVAATQLDITTNLEKIIKIHTNEYEKRFKEFEINLHETSADITRLKVDHRKNKVVVVDKDDEFNMPPVLPPKYPVSMSSTNNLYFDATGWPSKDECIDWDLPLSEQENLNLPIFIPPENKGYQISKMLGDNIDLPFGAEHKLPWYPPLCEHPNAEEFDPYVPPAVRQVINKPLPVHPIFKKHFMMYVNGGKGDEAEIGQRIITAISKKSGPSWVLATLASMYWRVRSNTKNALTCLDMPFDTVPKEDTDVILVSIASMLHQLGLVENSLKFASLAFKVNYLEPSTNFLLALIHYQKSNPILAMYYMKNVLRVDAQYYEGEAERLLKLWACRIKMGNYEPAKAKTEKSEEMCSDGGRDGFNGEGVICTANGDQCKTTAIQCFRTDNVKDDAHAKPISKILTSQQCGRHKLAVGQSLISTLLASEGSGSNEPDQSQLESLTDSPTPQDFHMRILFGDEYAPTGANTLGDFYVSVSVSDDPVPEAILQVYDKSGTYPLSNQGCKEIKDADWLHFSSMWQAISDRNINIAQYLRPFPKNLKEFMKPRCSRSLPPSTATLDHLTAMVLRNRLPNVPEPSLFKWLSLMATDQQATIKELGTRISIALQENASSWLLATAAALYWRIIGNTEEAVTCLRQALTFVPADMKDIPLISLANILHKVGFHGDALEVAYIAIESRPNFVVNHFTAGNIHTSLGDLEKAISFYRASLALESNFEPARNRLQAILCTLLFDESGDLRDDHNGLLTNN